MDDVEILRLRLAMTEDALRAERQHNAFLFGLLLGRRVPEVRPARSVWRRCADALGELLAGPGRG